MKRCCSPPGWLAAGAPNVGSELKYCFDNSVRGSLAITHPLDMSTPRCKEYGHPLRCQIFCWYSAQKPHILRKKRHQRNGKECLTFKISCTLGLSGAFAPGKLTWVPRENALKDLKSISFVWYCASVLSNKLIEVQRIQIFTVMFFGFSGERLKSTSICIALLFAFDINFLTHVEYNLENDIWILSSVTFCQLNQLFANSENLILLQLSLWIFNLFTHKGARSWVPLADKEYFLSFALSIHLK